MLETSRFYLSTFNFELRLLCSRSFPLAGRACRRSRISSYLNATSSRRPAKSSRKSLFCPKRAASIEEYVIQFYRAFLDLGCKPSHLSLFQPHTAQIADYLLDQDVIYVGGGNTKSMLALWREWGIDAILRQALDAGIVLTGVSAGAICWFERGTTDSIPGDLTALPCLGFLSGSLSPHYDGEAQRRPTYQRMIGGGEIPAGYAFEDGVAGHFVDGVLKGVVSSRPNAKGYYVEQVDGHAQETVLDTLYLGA